MERRSAPPNGPWGSGRTLLFFYKYWGVQIPGSTYYMLHRYCIETAARIELISFLVQVSLDLCFREIAVRPRIRVLPSVAVSQTQDWQILSRHTDSRRYKQLVTTADVISAIYSRRPIADFLSHSTSSSAYSTMVDWVWGTVGVSWYTCKRRGELLSSYSACSSARNKKPSCC